MTPFVSTAIKPGNSGKTRIGEIPPLLYQSCKCIARREQVGTNRAANDPVKITVQLAVLPPLDLLRPVIDIRRRYVAWKIEGRAEWVVDKRCVLNLSGSVAIVELRICV